MRKIFYYSLLQIILVSVCSCSLFKEKELPTLITAALTNITGTTATCGGTVTFDGNDNVTERGVCWSSLSTPYIFDNHTSDGTGTGSFVSAITGLTANTTYYVRAYATNSLGTNYGETVTFTTTTTTNPGTVTDIDGNVYNTIQIGTQVWMKENLKVTHYRNGDAIPLVTDGTAWSLLTTGGYCYYDNLTGNFSTYGGLYNFAAVSDSRNLAPLGWHVPSNSEWTTLISELGGASAAGGKMKETGNIHWTAPNLSTNSSDFTALSTGLRDQAGNYFAMGYNTYWWSTLSYDATYAYGTVLTYNNETALNTVYLKPSGFPIRCVKD